MLLNLKDFTVRGSIHEIRINKQSQMQVLNWKQ